MVAVCDSFPPWLAGAYLGYAGGIDLEDWVVPGVIGAWVAAKEVPPVRDRAAVCTTARHERPNRWNAVLGKWYVRKGSKVASVPLNTQTDSRGVWLT